MLYLFGLSIETHVLSISCVCASQGAEDTVAVDKVPDLRAQRSGRDGVALAKGEDILAGSLFKSSVAGASMQEGTGQPWASSGDAGGGKGVQEARNKLEDRHDALRNATAFYPSQA